MTRLFVRRGALRGALAIAVASARSADLGINSTRSHSCSLEVDAGRGAVAQLLGLLRSSVLGPDVAAHPTSEFTQAIKSPKRAAISTTVCIACPMSVTIETAKLSICGLMGVEKATPYAVLGTEYFGGLISIERNHSLVDDQKVLLFPSLLPSSLAHLLVVICAVGMSFDAHLEGNGKKKKEKKKKKKHGS